MKRNQIIFLIIFIIGCLFCRQLYAQSASADTLHPSKNITSKLTQEINAAKPEWTMNTGKIVWSVIILLIGFLLIKYLTRFLEALAERWPKSRLAIKRLIPILRVLGWTIILYIIIKDILQPPIATLVAVTASAGIAIGFASQDILKNIFGGVMILFDRTFQVGDKIEVSGHYGEVKSIGLRSVRIITPDDSVVAIPNSEIVNQSVSNANSGESNCQVVAEFYLPPNIDIIKVKKLAYQTAVTSRYIYLNKPVAIILKNEIHQGRSLLKLRLKAYVLDIRHEFQFSSEMTEVFIQQLLKDQLVTAEELSVFSSQNKNQFL